MHTGCKPIPLLHLTFMSCRPTCKKLQLLDIDLNFCPCGPAGYKCEVLQRNGFASGMQGIFPFFMGDNQGRSTYQNKLNRWSELMRIQSNEWAKAKLSPPTPHPKKDHERKGKEKWSPICCFMFCCITCIQKVSPFCCVCLNIMYSHLNFVHF